MLKRAFELSLVWIFSFFVPMVYLLILPSLSRADPFIQDSFFASKSETSDMSISSYLRNAPSNGGFAAFTSFAVVYTWTNEVAKRGIVVRVGSFFFTLGWLLSILLPLGFSSSAAHATAFAIGMGGFILTTIGYILILECSRVVWFWFILLISFDIVAISTYNKDFAFLFAEYIVAAVTLSFSPLVNTIGEPGTCMPKLIIVRPRITY